MKRLPRPLRSLVVPILLAAAVPAVAAVVPTEWRHRQELIVGAPGVVRVAVPDATFDAALPGLADLRLLDPGGRETALLLDRPTLQVARTALAASFEARLENGTTVLLVGTASTTDQLAAVTLETPHPRFLRAAKVELSDDRATWTAVDEGIPLFRQWGAEKLSLALGHRRAAWIRITVDDSLPFTGARLSFAAGPPETGVPVGARIAARDEFAGETVLTVALDGSHAPLAALELETPEPLFMRRVTVAVRDVRDLVSSERTVGTGTLYRVAVAGAPARAQLEMNFSHQPAARELLVHIHNGDSPPLAVTGVRLKREPWRVLFHAAETGRYTLLSGNAQASPPRYDLAALISDLRTAQAASVTPGPLQDMPGYQPRASLAEARLPDVPLTGAPFNSAGWTRRRPVQLAAPGVQELELDPAALAGARSDLADLRLLLVGEQIPFILERMNLARSLTLAFESVADPRRPGTSIWRTRLPHAGLPLLRLALASDTPLFERQFRIYEKVNGSDGRVHDHTLASGGWSRTPEPGSPRTRVFELGDRPQTDTLYLETDNGDNPPITLASMKAEHAVVRLVFKVAGTDGFELAYGNPAASAPRYDLSLVATRLLTATRSPARLGPEEAAREDFARGMLRHLKGGTIFWAALALVVVALLAVVAKMLPKPPATQK